MKGLFSGFALLLLIGCSDFYFSATKNGDAIYIPPADTVRDSIWVPDSLVIPRIFDLHDTLFREDLTPCENAVVSVSFHISTSDSIGDDQAKLTLVSGLQLPTPPNIELIKSSDSSKQDLSIDQYFSSEDWNYFFELELQDSGGYSLNYALDWEKNIGTVPVGIWVEQTGTQEGKIFASSFSEGVIDCLVDVGSEDSLKPGDAVWSGAIDVFPGDSLFANFNESDSLDVFVLPISMVTELLFDLNFENSDFSYVLYQRSLDSDAFNLKIEQEQALSVLYFNKDSVVKEINGELFIHRPIVTDN